MLLFDAYSHFRDESSYKKIVGNDYLIVEFKCPIDEEIFNAWSECHYITYVISGRKVWKTYEMECELGKGEAIFVKKGAYMNQQFLEDRFCVLMFFMNDDFLKRFMNLDLPQFKININKQKQAEPLQRVHVSESLSALYNSFFSYLKEGASIPDQIIELKFREMLLNIISNPANHGVKKLIGDIIAYDKSPIHQVMENNFYYNLSLEEFARLCGRSLSSFKRDFQKYYQLAPGKWLIAKRLERAKQRLSNTEDNVQEICFDSGFENPSHFTRIFRENFGITPIEFRKESAS